LHNEERKLDIRLTELQMKMQRKTSEYSTFTSLVLSSMIVIAFTLYTWAITQNDAIYIYAGVVVAVLFGLLFLALSRYYSNQLDDLEEKIQNLKEQYEW
jgi:ABC-type enterochelin transport system permease subunit